MFFFFIGKSESGVEKDGVRMGLVFVGRVKNQAYGKKREGSPPSSSGYGGKLYRRECLLLKENFHRCIRGQ